MERKAAYDLTLALMREHGVENLRFEWTKATKVFGSCAIERRWHDNTYTLVPVAIKLSWPMVEVNNEDRVRETVLHEIAHAIAARDHDDAGHGYMWKMVARRLGLTGDRCYSLENTVQPKLPWTGTCPNGHTVMKTRKPKNMRSCTRCCRGFNYAYVFTWTPTGTTPTPRPAPTPQPVLQAASTPTTDVAKKVLRDLRWRDRHSADYRNHTLFLRDGSSHDCDVLRVQDGYVYAGMWNAPDADTVRLPIDTIVRVSSKK